METTHRPCPGVLRRRSKHIQFCLRPITEGRVLAAREGRWEMEPGYFASMVARLKQIWPFRVGLCRKYRVWVYWGGGQLETATFPIGLCVCVCVCVCGGGRAKVIGQSSLVPSPGSARGIITDINFLINRSFCRRSLWSKIITSYVRPWSSISDWTVCWVWYASFRASVIFTNVNLVTVVRFLWICTRNLEICWPIWLTLGVRNLHLRATERVWVSRKSAQTISHVLWT